MDMTIVVKIAVFIMLGIMGVGLLIFLKMAFDSVKKQ
jgi:hypothetical protein